MENKKGDSPSQGVPPDDVGGAVPDMDTGEAEGGYSLCDDLCPDYDEEEV